MTRIVGTETAYPAEVETDANGTITAMRFFCAAHGEDVPCIDCENAEVEAFQRAGLSESGRYLGYVTGNTVMTFGGTPLAHISQAWDGRRRYTPSGGEYRMHYIRAVSHDGYVKWHGAYSDNGNAVILRRVKGSA